MPFLPQRGDLSFAFLWIAFGKRKRLIFDFLSPLVVHLRCKESEAKKGNKGDRKSNPFLPEASLSGDTLLFLPIPLYPFLASLSFAYTPIPLYPEGVRGDRRKAKG